MTFNHFIILFLIFFFLLTIFNSFSGISPLKTLNYESTEKFEEIPQTKPICDFSDPQSDICNMKGDIRTQGNISTIFFVPPRNKFIQKEEAYNFSPQSRRIMITKNVTVKHLHDQKIAPKCTVKTDIPAFVFSLGGPTGNIWHDFTEILIPLFLASKPLNHEVQFVIRDYQQWFVDKYKLILNDLSNYDIINFDKDKKIRCFAHLQVGLLNHRVFGIDPKRAFDRFDLFRFRMYVRTIFSLPLGVDMPYKMDTKPDKKPRLMLVLRTGIRKFLNENEVIKMIKKNGFELVTVEPKRTDNITEFSKVVDSCDVLMGVHGAALTNILFLRTNAIMIQIIPYGKMDNFAYLYYGKQAKEMKLRELHYSINPDESSLLDKYGWDHPVIKNPDLIYEKGWRERRKYYWEEQNIRLNVTRFEPILVNMTGDIRTRANSTVFFVLPSNETFSKEHEWTFSPYSDKVFGSKQVTVKQLRANQDGPICTIRSDIPAVIFALRGQNLWHYISDIIIPLFLAAKPYNGEVQLVIIDYHQWFVDKYNLILKDLTRYEIINFDQDKEVRCYPHAMVGLLSHRLLGIDPKRAFDRYDLYKFRLYLRKVFSLPMDLDVPYKADPTVDKKPRLMLVLRSGFRKLLNEPEISEMIEKLGFELIKIEPKKSDNLTELSKLVDSCDVIMGVHGAGLTNMLFLRTNAIMIQIVMYGHIESFAYDYFGRQATDMKLRQLNYSVAAEESSLLEKYGWNHSCIKDPDSVNAKGWQDRMKYYWIEQNIRLNVTSFEPVLVKALQMIKE